MMRNYQDPIAVLLNLGILSPLEAFDEDLNRTVFSKRLDIERLLSALYNAYDPSNPLHPDMPAHLVGLVSILLQFPTQGAFSKAELSKVLANLNGNPTRWLESDNEVDQPLLQINSVTEAPSPSFFAEKNLKSFMAKVQVLRALTGRTLRALDNTVTSEVIHASVFPAVCIAALVPFIRLSLYLFFAMKYAVGSGALSNEENALSRTDRFGDQWRRTWRQLLQDGPFTAGRLLACVVPYLVENPQPMTLGLFAYSAIKAILTVYDDNKRYKQLRSGVVNQYAVFAEPLANAKKRVMIDSIKQEVIWTLLALSAAVNLMGALMPKEADAGKVMRITGSWLIVLWTIAHVINEFTRVNPLQLNRQGEATVPTQILTPPEREMTPITTATPTLEPEAARAFSL